MELNRPTVIYDSRGNIVSSGGLGLDMQTGQPVDLNAFALAGSFQGAGFSRDRGYVYVPTIDSKREVDSRSRVELNKRARFVYASGGGLMHRCVDGVARMVVGTGLLPHPTPTRVRGREMKIREWSRNVRRLFMERCGSKITYDLSRRRNAFQMQRQTMRCKIVDGDSAKVLIRDEDTGRLRRMLYEANQIGNGTSKPVKVGDGWHDGVLCGPHNQPLKYRFNVCDDNGKETSTDIPAENVLHSLNDQRINQMRGLTRFYPVLNKVLDRGEILAALTKGIKVVNQFGYAIEEQMQSGKTTAGAEGTTLPSLPTTKLKLASGKEVKLEEFLNGGVAVGLKPGQSIKVVQAQNPHPNVQAYLLEMVRDIAWAIGYSPEILWSIIELGGANMRFVQADLAQQIECEQDDLVDQDLGPDYVAWLYDMIVSGEVEEIDGWERHVWISPARLTVDFGRDGKLYIEELKRGIRTMQSMYGMRGEIAEVGIEDYLDERQMTIQGIYDRTITVNGVTRSMTFEEAFPEIRQQTIETSTSDAQADANGASQADTQAMLQSMDTKLNDIAHVIAFAREPK